MKQFKFLGLLLLVWLGYGSLQESHTEHHFVHRKISLAASHAQQPCFRGEAKEEELDESQSSGESDLQEAVSLSSVYVLLHTQQGATASKDLSRHVPFFVLYHRLLI
jgi:hypothetical protein